MASVTSSSSTRKESQSPYPVAISDQSTGKHKKRKSAPPSYRGTEMVTVYCEPDPEDGDEVVEKQFNVKEETGDESRKASPPREENGGAKESEHSNTTMNESNTPGVVQADENKANEEAKTAETEKNRRTFTIHKSFACYYSPFFDRAFNGPSIEGTTNYISIQADPDTFSILMDWLYSQKLRTATGDPSGYDLIDLWLLADKLQIPRLQNEAITAYYRNTLENIVGENKWDDGFYATIPMRVWRQTLSDSPLRKLLIKNYAWNYYWSYEHFETDIQTLPKEMLLDLAIFNHEQKEDHESRRLPIFKTVWMQLKIEEFYVSEEPLQNRHDEH